MQTSNPIVTKSMDKSVMTVLISIHHHPRLAARSSPQHYIHTKLHNRKGLTEAWSRVAGQHEVNDRQDKERHDIVKERL